MRVLQVHNQYQSSQPSGENVSCSLIADALVTRGHDVVKFWPDSDLLVGKQKALHAGGPFGVGPTAKALRKLVESAKFDAALVHNAYPTLGPPVVSLLKSRGIPIAHVVHNYRHSCIAGSHWRSSAPCTDCLSSPLRISGALHRCYRDSFAQSGLMVASEFVSGRHWKKLDVIVYLSEWMRAEVDRLSPLQAKEHRVVYDPVQPAVSGQKDRSDFIYVGRLSEEKGILLLLTAWELAGLNCRLHIAGDGPLAKRVVAATQASSNVIYHGKLSVDAVAELRTETAIACVPALWNEPFGRVAAEAHAAGQPVLTTPRGALSEIVVEGTGLVVTPDVDSWVAALRRFAGIDISAMSAAARQNWNLRFSVERAGEGYDAALRAATAQS